MQSLINDLLLLTQLESGPHQLEPELVFMPDLVNRIAIDLKEFHSSDVEIELQLTRERKLMGIEKDLLSVCSNLMTNAIRYSLDAQPIRVSWEDVDENRTRLMVEDKGVGIPQEHLERITERFYRVDIA